MSFAIFYVHGAAQRNQKDQEKHAKDDNNDALAFCLAFGALQAMLIRQVKPLFADSTNDTSEAHIAPTFLRVASSIFQASDSSYACRFVRTLVVRILSVSCRPPPFFCVYVFPRYVCARWRVSDATEPESLKRGIYLPGTMHSAP